MAHQSPIPNQESQSTVPRLTVNTDVTGEGHGSENESQTQSWWKLRRKAERGVQPSSGDSESDEQNEKAPERWSLGILNDRKTEEVPGR